MKRVLLGDTGISVSEMCLGTQMFGDRCDERESACIVERALASGVDFLDTAALYVNGRTEEILGRIVKSVRERVFLVTKVRLDMAGIIESLEASLRRLRTDYVDLYLIHAPLPGMDVRAVMKELELVVRNGKARFIGCSNYPAWLVAYSNRIAREEGWPTLVANQIPYSLIERGVEVEILPQCYVEHIAAMAYRPLGMGILSGKYQPGMSLPANSRSITDDRIPKLLNRYGHEIQAFLNMANELNISPSTLALAWVRKHPAITSPIVGVSSLAQLETNLSAFEFELSDDMYRQLTELFAATAPFEIATWKPFADMRRDIHLARPLS